MAEPCGPFRLAALPRSTFPARGAGQDFSVWRDPLGFAEQPPPSCASRNPPPPPSAGED